MKRRDQSRYCRVRSGKVLVLFALTLPALLGMTGLVIDSGMLMATHRTAQNAADAGAMATAMDLYRGSSRSTAETTGTTFIQTYNHLSSATVTINIPPLSGAYSGNASYAETIVSIPYTTSLIQVLGASSSQTISARSVAGYEPIGAGQGVIALRTDVIPGLGISGSGQFVVNGGVVVNSLGGGVDQYGNTVSGSGYGIGTTGSGFLKAVSVEVAGGVNNPSYFRNYDSGNPNSPLFARAPVVPDPLQSLPTPNTSNGVVGAYWQYLGNGQWGTASSPQVVSITGSQPVTFSPGLYGKVTVSGSGTITFNPGIYVIMGGGFNISGSGTITDNNQGVMIYNTGADYTPSTGAPDSSDGSTLGTDSSANFGKVNISGSGTIALSPLTSGSFSGMLFYERRWNSQDFNISGSGQIGATLNGMIYDKWGAMNLSGSGSYNSEFIVGSMNITGSGNYTIDTTGKNTGRANQVFLVE